MTNQVRNSTLPDTVGAPLFASHKPANPSSMNADAKGGFQKGWINNSTLTMRYARKKELDFHSNSHPFRVVLRANYLSIRCNPQRIPCFWIAWPINTARPINNVSPKGEIIEPSASRGPRQARFWLAGVVKRWVKNRKRTFPYAVGQRAAQRSAPVFHVNELQLISPPLPPFSDP